MKNTCSVVSHLCGDLLEGAGLHGSQIHFGSCWRELGGEQFMAAGCGTQLMFQIGIGLSISFKTRMAGERNKLLNCLFFQKMKNSAKTN